MNNCALPPTETFSIAPMICLVDPYAAWLASLEPAQYTAPPPGHQTGSIGGHTRHALDHVRALVRGQASGIVDYDARERNVPEEQDPQAACASWQTLRAALLEIADSAWEKPVTACAAQSSNGSRVAHASTLAREVSFVFSHTVHHFAIVSLVAQLHGIKVPYGLGMAPSTLAFQKTTAACAQ